MSRRTDSGNIAEHRVKHKNSAGYCAFGTQYRYFWLLLSRSWLSWKETLLIVKPETVLRWHRKRFASYWTRLSGKNRPDRPGKDRQMRELIGRMASSNPLWGSPRIHGEVLKLGMDISEQTVTRLMPKRKKSPSQTWRAFLDNHCKDLVSVDFFVVPTETFGCQTKSTSCCRLLLRLQNGPHPADNPADQPDFDSVRMSGRPGENQLHDAFRQFPGPLILFLHDRNPHSQFDICSLFSAHDCILPKQHRRTECMRYCGCPVLKSST
jgi:hypothetical protein